MTEIVFSEERLSATYSKRGALQREVINLLREHERDGAIPTSNRFLFYELEQRGIIPKKNCTSSVNLPRR